MNVVDHNALQAKQSMNKAVDLMVQMEENLKAEEEVLYERANRLRRQSADAFKLMDDAKKIQRQVILRYCFCLRNPISQNIFRYNSFDYIMIL